MDTSNEQNSNSRISQIEVQLIIIICLIAIIIAIIAGWLMRSGGSPLQYSVLYGGGAFVVAVTLMLTIAKAVGLLGRKH
jgi:hypothetical protein